MAFFGVIPVYRGPRSGPMPLPLTEVFPDEDYRFHLTLRPADAAAFFAPTAPDVLAERRQWIETDPVRYVAATEDGTPLIDEFETLAAKWTGGSEIPRPESATDRVRRLGMQLQPDYLLLSADDAGAFRLRAGAVCFPSSWALEEKIGHTLEEIHGPVPTLNASLGPTIGRFLARLKPGNAFERANWGAAATPELNLHPALGRPRLVAPLRAETTWIRIEDQLLAALPGGAGILFGIRLRIVPLPALLDDPLLRGRMVRALATMPEPVVAYKGLAPLCAALA